MQIQIWGVRDSGWDSVSVWKVEGIVSIPKYSQAKYAVLPSTYTQRLSKHSM